MGSARMVVFDQAYPKVQIPDFSGHVLQCGGGGDPIQILGAVLVICIGKTGQKTPKNTFFRQKRKTAYVGGGRLAKVVFFDCRRREAFQNAPFSG